MQSLDWQNTVALYIDGRVLEYIILIIQEYYLDDLNDSIALDLVSSRISMVA